MSEPRFHSIQDDAPGLIRALDRVAALHPLERKVVVASAHGAGRELLRTLARMRGGWTGFVVETPRPFALQLASHRLAGAGLRVLDEFEEEARRTAPESSPVSERLDRALRSMDWTFMGTIHAFCARLLRERPLEAGLDPAFREMTAQEDGRFLEGVIDLVFREEDGWVVVVDYKTDRGDAPDFDERVKRYRNQVGADAQAWNRITGEDTKESLVWTLASGIPEAGGGAG